MPWTDIFAFELHHIFQENLDIDLRVKLRAIGIEVDSVGNTKPTWATPGIATLLQQLPEGPRAFLQKAGWGVGDHSGGGKHPQYSTFFTEILEDIFDEDSRLTPDQQRLAAYDLHRFGNELTTGKIASTGIKTISKAEIYSLFRKFQQPTLSDAVIQDRVARIEILS